MFPRYLVIRLAAVVLASLFTLPAFAEDTIKLGHYGAFTGKDGAFGLASRKGVILAVEEVNAAGGVLGRKLELFSEDNQSKNGESATIAKKLIGREKVIAVLGGNASTNSLEAAPICQTARVPMIAISSTNPRVTELGDYIFRVCFIDPFQGAVLAKFSHQRLQAKRVAILTSISNPYAVGLTKVFKEQFALLGGEIIADQKHSEGDKDFRAQLTAIKAAKPDAIFVSGYYTEGALICKQARALGLDAVIFGGDGWEAPELITIGGAAVEGTYYSAHYSKDSPAPEVVNFIAKFRARWDGETPDGIAANGYDAVLLLVEAIKRARTTDGPALRDAIATTKGFAGVTGRITIDAQRNAAKPAVILTIKNGKFEFVESVAP